MIKYFCFRPLSIENERCCNIDIDNINRIDEAIKKRRWKIVGDFHPISASNITEYKYLDNQIENTDILSIGIKIDLNTISKDLLSSDFHHPFYIIEQSHLEELFNKHKDVIDYILKHKIVFIENKGINPINVAELIKLKEYSVINKKLLIESCYDKKIDDFSFGSNIYLDFSKLFNIKKLFDIDYKKYFISTSYTDVFNLRQNNELVGWEFFRSKGIFDMINFLRNQKLTEKEIVNCTYYKFINLFSTNR